jgi:hypothetical protein
LDQAKYQHPRIGWGNGHENPRDGIDKDGHEEAELAAKPVGEDS